MGVCLLLGGCAEPPGDPAVTLRRLRREAPAEPPPTPMLQAEAWRLPQHTASAPAVETASRFEEPPRQLLAIGIGTGAGEFLAADFEPQFERQNQQFDLSRASTSNRDAIDLVQVGRIDAAIVLGELSPRDLQAGLRQTEIGQEVFALVTAPRPDLRNLNHHQVRELLTGQTSHWSALGSDAGSVALVLPSGTLAERAARCLIAGDALTDHCVRTDCDEKVFDQLLCTPGAVGVVRLATARRAPDVQLLAIDTVLPAPETFGAGTYPYGQRLVLVTAGPVSGAALRLLQFLRTEACQAALGQHLTLARW